MTSTLTAKQMKQLVRQLQPAQKQATKNNKPKAKSRRGRKLRNAGSARSMRSVGNRSSLGTFGDKTRVVSSVGHMPAAWDNVRGNSTWSEVEGKVIHPREGPGIAICGCQPFSDVNTAAAASDFFTASTLATMYTGLNTIGLSPDALNGPLAAQANLHQKYVFTDVMLEYTSNVATSQAGSFALSYIQDGANVNPPTNFSEARQIVPSLTANFRSDTVYLHIHYDGDEVYWTENETATLAGRRQTFQGIIHGFPSANTLGVLSMGYLNVYYRIELYQSVNSQGFTFLRGNTGELPLMKQLARIVNLREPGVSLQRVLREFAEELDDSDDGVISERSHQSKRTWSSK